MGNCPVKYDCSHEFKDVCDWNCIPDDYHWTQSDFDYHRAYDKLHKHCKYYEQHETHDFCDYCTVNCEKIYRIITQEYESMYEIKKNDLCYDLKFPNEKRFRLERIYNYDDKNDIRFMHRCINCDCNVAYTASYFRDIKYSASIELNNLYMFCYDCYIQKQTDFTNKNVNYNSYFTEDLFESSRREYFSKIFKCNCICKDKLEYSYHNHTRECDANSDRFNMNDFLSGNVFYSI